MYGLPDKLDLLKKDKGDVLVLVNKLHAVSKNYKRYGCNQRQLHDKSGTGNEG